MGRLRLADVALALVGAGLGVNTAAALLGQDTLCSRWIRPTLHVDHPIGYAASAAVCTAAHFHFSDIRKVVWR